MLLNMAGCSSQSERPVREQVSAEPVMLILRGVESSEKPRGQLDDQAALEYARRLGFRGQALDVAGNPGLDSAQVQIARERIREDQSIKAIYGFSGGGYNARLIWAQMSTPERDRIRKVVQFDPATLSPRTHNGRRASRMSETRSMNGSAPWCGCYRTFAPRPAISSRT
jgi:hypothetical protein